MEKLCDLHTHSLFSDGTCTPAELIRLAEEAVAAYQQRPVDAIGTHDRGDVHILFSERKKGQAEPQRNQPTQCTAHHSAYPLSVFLL